MRVAFLVNDLQLSGGVGVVVGHALELSQREVDVTLVLVREWDVPHWPYGGVEGLHVRDLDSAREEQFDVAVATWWETTFALFSLRARRYAWFVQNLEDRFYGSDEPERLGAGLVQTLPVDALITEARWLARLLDELRPDTPCLLVRNGVDKRVFAPIERVVPNVSQPLRVLVEGHPSVWFKGVREAIDAVGQMTEPHELTVVCGDPEGASGLSADRVLGPLTHTEMADAYSSCDVVLKLSRVEGMYGPPLEGFHRGTTVVTTAVTGHDEYVVHGHNGLVVEWDDPRGTARALDLLARDRSLLHELRCNALLTARAWPSREQSGEFMAAALRTIVRRPPQALPATGALHAADARAALEDRRRLVRERGEMHSELQRAARITTFPLVRTALRLRHRRPLRWLRRRAPSQ